MSLLDTPLWIQIPLAGEALAVIWLTARFGWRGLGWSLLASAVCWFALGLAASFLVGRLEGGRAADLGGMIPGAGLATLRLALIAWPLLLGAGVIGGGLRYLGARRNREPPTHA